MRNAMDISEEKPSKGCGGHCCSINRCQCGFLLAVFLGLVVAVAVLGALYSQQKQRDALPEVPVTTPAPPTETKPWESHRLPDYILPDHYDLTLYPDFYDGHDRFYGNVTIRLNVTVATMYLLIHIRDLTVTKTNLKRGGNALGMKRAFHHAPNEYWVVEAEKSITPGQVEVDLQFEGSLVNGIVGLYKSVYVDSRTNETKYLATSKFQPTDARKAFPCLDEPGFKSTFTTTLIHRKNLMALSNMPVERNSTWGAGLQATHFQKSVPMVTYLKCFIVSEFAYKENTTKNGTPFRVYATPDKVDQVDYSLDIGVRILEHYEQYYGLKYPLPKLDMIAIPDFVSGAMEHWGLITYREIYLLYEEGEASLANKQRVAVVVAHELAHMWFGNLVTMKWWDDLWLNEGFASFVEYLGVNHVHPEWDVMDNFVVSDIQRVMPDDSKISSHPIIVPVDHPSEITEVFDSISYSKGASVIRMLQAFMGESKFIQGLHAYIRDYQFLTTVTDDLWADLEKVPGQLEVKAIMDTWTRQMGYPVVTVEIQGSKLKLTQERFLLDPNADKTYPPSPFKYKWRIPIKYQTEQQGESSFYWMNNDELIITPPINPSTDWIKLNTRQEGYYRVNYTAQMWERLANLLDTNHELLSPSDRSGLIDDIFTLASADKSLGLIKYMNKEEHLVPWSTVSGKLNFIHEMMITTVHYEKWQNFMQRLVSPVLQRFGYEDVGDHLGRQLRSVLIGLACGHADDSCLSNMTKMFRDRLNGEHISPNIRSRVYRYGMQVMGGEDQWDFMWREYGTAVVPQEKTRLLYAVAQTQEPWLIQRLLTYAMDKAKVRDQDFFSLISYLSSNDVALPFTWSFARENWPTLVDRFDINNRYLGRMVPGISRYFNTENKLQEVKDFFAKYPESGAGARAREQALEQIQGNIDWMSTNLDSVVTWLDANAL